MNDTIKLYDWLKEIADKGSHEELIDNIYRHATEHIQHEPYCNWIDSMLNMCVIYNIMNNRMDESIKNRLDILEKYKKKHNSEI